MCQPSAYELERINRFIRKRQQFGNSWCWPLRPDHHADLAFFAFQNNRKGNGRAKRLLQTICKWADKNGCSIWLFTYNYRLVLYYHELGFELTDHDKLHMVRKPIIKA